MTTFSVNGFYGFYGFFAGEREPGGGNESMRGACNFSIRISSPTHKPVKPVKLIKVVKDSQVVRSNRLTLRIPAFAFKTRNKPSYPIKYTRLSVATPENVVNFVAFWPLAVARFPSPTLVSRRDYPRSSARKRALDASNARPRVFPRSRGVSALRPPRAAVFVSLELPQEVTPR